MVKHYQFHLESQHNWCRGSEKNEKNEKRIDRVIIELKREKEKNKKLQQENMSFWSRVIALQTKLVSKEHEQVAAKLVLEFGSSRP